MFFRRSFSVMPYCNWWKVKIVFFKTKKLKTICFLCMGKSGAGIRRLEVEPTIVIIRESSFITIVNFNIFKILEKFLICFYLTQKKTGEQTFQFHYYHSFEAIQLLERPLDRPLPMITLVSPESFKKTLKWNKEFYLFKPPPYYIDNQNI